MSTLDLLEDAARRAGVRVGRPVLEVIDSIGDAEISVWASEIAAQGLRPPRDDDMRVLKTLAASLFPTKSAPTEQTLSVPTQEPTQPPVSTMISEPPRIADTGSPATETLSRFSTNAAPPARVIGNVRFDVDASGTTLSWDPYVSPTGDEVVYLIIGGDTEADFRPSVEGRLASTSATTILLPATPRHISIFAYSGPTPDQAAAGDGRLIASGELIPEVTLTKALSTPWSITMEWVNPQGATQNRVFRSLANKPLSANYDDDEEIDLSKVQVGYAQQQGLMVVTFTDSNLHPSSDYEYRVHCVVSLPDGRTRESRGLVKTISTEEKLMPVEVIHAQPLFVGGLPALGAPAISLIWKELEFGEVRIIHSINNPQSEALVPGRTKPLENLDALGDEVIHLPDAFQDGHAKISRIELPDQDLSKIPDGSPVTHCYTAVTKGKDSFVVGATAAVPLIAAVNSATLVDRVDWHLIRLRWPKGASSIEADATVGEGPHMRVIETVRVSRDDFNHVGGVMMRKLGGTPSTISVRGVCPMGKRSYYGAAFIVKYEGHQLLQYAIKTETRMAGLKKNYERKLIVEREGNLREPQMLLIAGASALPLTASQNYPTPDFVHLARTMISSETIQEQMATPVPLQPIANPEVNPPYIRLLSKPTHVWDEQPMLAWKILPEIPSHSKPQASRGSVCPECFVELPLDRRFFVCAGACPREADSQRATRLGQAGAQIRTITMIEAATLDKGQGHGPLPLSASCYGCQQTTTQVICPVCHALLPPAWADTELLTISIAGTKGSGKSVFMWSLLPYLRDGLIKDLGGGMQPSANSISARAKMDEINLLTSNWMFPDGTATLKDNAELRLPLLFSLGSVLNCAPGHMRALSFFDMAGEMLEDQNGAMDAREILGNSDLVVMMLDVRQIDALRSVLSIQDKFSEMNPNALLDNLLIAIGQPRRYPRLAIVLNQFDLVHEGANLDGSIAEILNRGSQVFRDPYALHENRDTLYLERDAAMVDAECRQFLTAVGWAGFVRKADEYPGEAQFFAISAVGGDPSERVVPEDGISPFRVADPMRWVMFEEWVARQRGTR